MQSESDPKNEAAAGDLLAAASGYAAAGLLVLPLHSASGRRCSCGKPDCDSAGKHPRTTNGLSGASRDVAVVARWWQRWPNANVGIRTGPESGLAVLDVDPRHGGLSSLEKLKAKLGPLPRGPQVLTGSGGQHWYFAFPAAGVGNSAGKLGPGLDVRGERGYVIAPPSLHSSGNPYVWRRGLEHELPDPGQLFEGTASRRNGAAAAIEEIIPEGRRREELLSLAGTMRRRGMSSAEMLPALQAVNEHRCRPPLAARELEHLAADVEDRYRPDPEQGLRTMEPAVPKVLGEVVDAFTRWLHLPDTGPLFATLAAVAANRLPQLDPTWLSIVGPSGGGKTEILNSVAKLDEVHLAATLTEASLLSGTSRRERADDARGGLLHEIGERGVILLKDFGSVLSMHRDARSQVLAGLREIYDGSWTRRVGTDGGRQLHWEGHVGLLAGATPAIDQHHGVMAQLGERFLFYRLTVAEAGEQARRSLRHQGRERAMRGELAEAVRGLFASLELREVPALAEGDEDALVSLATLVARARSSVIRDSYSREVELVPDAEAPGRIVGALGRLLIGLRAVGVADAQTWDVVRKTALDSMPAPRRRALELLVGADKSPSTTEVATRLGLPTKTAHRVLEDLPAHGVIARLPQGPGKADLWQIELWAAEQYLAGHRG